MLAPSSFLQTCSFPSAFLHLPPAPSSLLFFSLSFSHFPLHSIPHFKGEITARQDSLLYQGRKASHCGFRRETRAGPENAIGRELPHHSPSPFAMQGGEGLSPTPFQGHQELLRCRKQMQPLVLQANPPDVRTSHIYYDLALFHPCPSVSSKLLETQRAGYFRPTLSSLSPKATLLL